MALGGAFVATALTLWSASEPHATGLRAPDPDPQAIVGGEPTDPGEFEGVVALLAGQGLCTGTMVSDRVILTAGHCLDGIDDAEDIEVFYGPELSSDNSLAVESFGIHPEYCPPPACNDDIFDFGYLLLTQDVPVEDGIVLPIYDQDEWNQTMGVGGAVTIVGYGEDPDAEDANRGIGTKREVMTWISSVTDTGFEFGAGGNQRDSCKGDSGGPAFVQLTSGEWRLAGLVSRGGNPCGNGGIYAVPYPALQWLRQETDLNLCGSACGTCDCLVTAPEKDEGCGSCTVDDPEHWPGTIGLGLLVLLAARRRR